MPENDELRELGQRLRELREATGLDRRQFADKIGVSYATLKNAENGQQRLGSRTMRDAERVAKREADDWRRVADGFGKEANAPSTPTRNVNPSGQNGIPEAMIIKAIDEMADPDVQAAADALVKATSMSRNEALATVIARRISAK